MIFYTIQGLQNLINSNQIWIDGTFKTCPKLFHQLYVIHGSVLGHVFPFVYCLTTRKTQDTYTTILQHLFGHASEIGFSLNPPRVSCDFELAAINAVEHVFPNASIGGCLFHLTQTIFRYAVNHCGLKRAYNENEDVKKAVNYLFGLPFIPIPMLFDVFDDLFEDIQNSNLQNLNDVVDLYSYMEHIFIRGTAARGRRRATPPRYRPEIWNMYESTRARLARTNNFAEAWNAKFTKLIVTHHSNLWKFLENLKKDERDNNQLIVQLLGGHQRIRHPIRRSYLTNHLHIEAMVDNFDFYVERGEIKTYLLAIAFRLKRPTEGEESEDEQN